MWQLNWYLHLKRTSLSFQWDQMLAYCSISIEIQATDGLNSWLLTQQWGNFDGNISKIRCHLYRSFPTLILFCQSIEEKFYISTNFILQSYSNGNKQWRGRSKLSSYTNTIKTIVHENIYQIWHHVYDN